MDNAAQVTSEAIQALRATIARLERGTRAAPRAGSTATLAFGLDAIDAHLPDAGLAPGLHEIAGRGRDLEAATTPALLAGSLFAHGPRRRAPVLWVVEKRDLFMPGLAATGLDTRRVIMVEAGREVLAVAEEAARNRGLAGVVFEWGGRLALTASRRLLLAGEEGGVPVLAIRRPHVAVPPGTVSPVDAPNAAVTRWRIATLPSRPVEPIETGPFSLTLGRALWRLELVRARNAAPASWIVEAFDETGRLALPAAFADRTPAPAHLALLRRGAAAWAPGDLVA
jgi:protein ImuA